MESSLTKNNKDVLIIIQVRFNSKRLPGKTLLCLDNTPILSHVIERAKLIKSNHSLMCAIADDQGSNKIIEICNKMNVNYYVGSEENVLERFYYASRKYKSKYIMRITSDCPLIDPFVCNQLIDFIYNNNFDYVSNVGAIMYPHGLDCEIFKTSQLEKAYNKAIFLYEKEHVTQNIRNNLNTKVGSMSCPHSGIENLRWTIDNMQDLKVLKRVFVEFRELIKLKTYFPLAQAIINSKDTFYLSNFKSRYEGLINSVNNEDLSKIPVSKIDSRIIDKIK